MADDVQVEAVIAQVLGDQIRFNLRVLRALQLVRRGEDAQEQLLDLADILNDQIEQHLDLAKARGLIDGD